MRYIEISDLTFYYDDEPILEDVSYHVGASEFVILAGEDGAAKSVLVGASLGLLKPSRGMIEIAEKDQEREKLSIGYTPQQVASFNASFPGTVIKLIRSGKYPRGRWFKCLPEEDHQYVQRTLETIGVWDMRNRRIGELSGGQKQRINLAHIFTTDPNLFVLDKPTTGTDEESRNEFYRLLRHSAHAHGKSVLVVTHDHEDIKQYADRQIRLVRKEDSQWCYFHMSS